MGMKYGGMQVVARGNLTRDPELRTVGSRNTEMAQFRIAVTIKGYGGRADNTSYYSVSVFGPQATTVMQWLKKGRAVEVTGRLELREFQGRDGAMRTDASITSYNVDFLDFGDNKRDGDGGAENSDYQGYQDDAAPVSAEDPDDIPF
jgi:single-strand DNA-binding protein